MQLAPTHEVVAVDLNPVQLAYAAQRLAGGASVVGTAERVMAFGRLFAPLVGWRRGRVREFLELADPGEQREYWERHLDTWRFRAATSAFFSLTALRAVYARSLLGFLPRRLGQVMRGRLARGFARNPNRTNPYARALVLGELADVHVPAEAKQVRLEHADAAAFLEAQPPASFDVLTLSPILDGARPEYRARLFDAVRRAARPDAVVVLRSFAEPRSELRTNRAEDDRSMLWGVVDVRPAAELGDD
jgi:S-adenosylmethionine:diacylglycerol 3-amino-3-carboxypropyl transferase